MIGLVWMFAGEVLLSVNSHFACKHLKKIVSGRNELELGSISWSWKTWKRLLHEKKDGMVVPL